MQVWRPLGHILAAAPQTRWSCSHAAYPIAFVLADGRVRVFFSTRDAHNRASTASVDLDIEDENWRIASEVRVGALTPGARGAFDADGVTMGCVVADAELLLGYYLGWTVLVSVPFTNFIGLAVSRDGGLSFTRHSVAPVIGRSEANPFTIGYPCVRRLGTGWRMWFGSHLGWGAEGHEMRHVIKHADSSDGRTWTPATTVDIPLAGACDAAEFAISRPWVVDAGGGCEMWYARRNPGYVLGYATSDDGLVWHREDSLLRFAGRTEDWEDRERTYPCVFDHGKRRYMLYNGNGYGRTGFGLAVLER